MATPFDFDEAAVPDDQDSLVDVPYERNPDKVRKTKRPPSKLGWIILISSGFLLVIGFFICLGLPRDNSPRIIGENDDAETFTKRYGAPTLVDSTESQVPRPFFVTRILVYKRHGVKVWCIPDAPAGSPPPYPRWIIFRFVGIAENAPISPLEAHNRMTRKGR